MCGLYSVRSPSVVLCRDHGGRRAGEGGTYRYARGVVDEDSVMAWAVWVTIDQHLVFLRRVGMEDEVLREEFGSEWEEWATRTPSYDY